MTTAGTAFSATASNVTVTYTTGGWNPDPPPSAPVPAVPGRPPGMPPVLAAARAPDGTWEVPRAFAGAVAPWGRS